MDNNDFLTSWGLSLMVFLPVAGALLMMLIPKAEEQLHKVVALGSSLVSAAVPEPSTSVSTMPWSILS